MSLINKYNISEKDLYQLGVIESKKKSSGLFEKEKLKAASLKILKPYNVKFLDLGNLLNEIKNGGFDTKYSENFSESEKQEANTLIRENSNVSNFYKDWWSGKSKKQKWVLIIGVLFVVGLIGKLFEPNVDPCKCAEVGANVQIIGYDNLSDESKKIFNACESKYSTPAQAYEACVDKVSNESK
jgi:hypothetical protein